MPAENSTQAATTATDATATASTATNATATASTATTGATSAETTPILGADATKTESTATAAKETVPEKYEFTAPKDQALDASQLEAYSPVFKELGLTQSQAQKLIDKSFEIMPKLAEASQAQVQAEIVKQNAEWAKAAREDAEYGGANYEANVKVANAAFSQFASPALRQVLKESGYASHPEFVRLFVAIGKKLGESAAPTTGASPAVARTTAAALYPSMAAN